MMDIPPEVLANMIDTATERRRQAVNMALMLAANARLPAWSVFDYAFALERFMATGLPPEGYAQAAQAAQTFAYRVKT